MSRFFVFDVESVGLHGDGFAVGWVLIDREGREIEAKRYHCDPMFVLRADRGGLDWVQNHCGWVFSNKPTHDCPWHIREDFFNDWLMAAGSGAIMAADVPWPVEARFLSAAIDDHPHVRAWKGPYPLIDIASVRFAAGLDPLAACERLPSELPMHCPLADARQSARLLVEALKKGTP